MISFPGVAHYDMDNMLQLNSSQAVNKQVKSGQCSVVLMFLSESRGC